jgi:hypothetical protein
MKDKTIRIGSELLGRLIDRLEARIAPNQQSVNERIEADRALVDEARHLLRPSFKRTVDEFASWSLEELRMGREVALKNGNTARAFALATAIDRKRGLY